MRYSGGTLTHSQIDASSRVTLINELKAAVVSAGWTATGIYAYVVGTFSGLPSNNQTAVIDSVTYKFVTSLSAPNDVLIGGTAEECIDNWVDAVMDNSANEGTTYGTGTAVHPTCSASKDSPTVIRISSKTAGPGSPFTVSEGLSNFGWSWTTANFGGWKCTTQRNEAGHYCWMRLVDSNGVDTLNVRVYVEDPAWTATGYHQLAPAASRVLEVIAGKYAVWVCLLGTADPAAGVHLTVGLLYTRDFHRPRVVASVSDSGGEIQVNLDAAHGRVSGDHVYVAYGEGLTAVNGRWEITVVDSDSYTLNGSTYGGGYVANSARAGGIEQITRCFVGFGNATWGRWGLRDSCAIGLTGMTFGFNQFSYLHGSASINMAANFFLWYSGAMSRIFNLGGAADLLEARFGWTVTGSGQRFMVGEFYDAFLTNVGVPIDTMLYDFDGRNWFCYCDGGDYSLWIADGIVS